jgi:hypothetical protein
MRVNLATPYIRDNIVTNQDRQEQLTMIQKREFLTLSQNHFSNVMILQGIFRFLNQTTLKFDREYKLEQNQSSCHLLSPRAKKRMIIKAANRWAKQPRKSLIEDTILTVTQILTQIRQNIITTSVVTQCSQNLRCKT